MFLGSLSKETPHYSRRKSRHAVKTVGSMRGHNLLQDKSCNEAFTPGSAFDLENFLFLRRSKSQWSSGHDFAS